MRDTALYRELLRAADTLLACSVQRGCSAHGSQVTVPYCCCWLVYSFRLPLPAAVGIGCVRHLATYEL